MFTGLVEEVAEIIEVINGVDDCRFKIQCSQILEDIKVGDSISVNGACQTVEKFSREEKYIYIYSFSDTLKVTNFRYFHVGSKVNLERAMKLGDRIGGHLVQGHVEKTCNVLSTSQSEEHLDIWLDLISPFVIPKGSITVNGISLTIQEVDIAKGFRIQIIPETVKATNVSTWQVNDKVNIETDYIISSLDYIKNFTDQQS